MVTAIPTGCLSNPTPHPAADAGPHGEAPPIDDADARTGAPDPDMGMDDASNQAGADAGPADACQPGGGDVSPDLIDGGADGGGAGCDDGGVAADAGPVPEDDGGAE